MTFLSERDQLNLDYAIREQVPDSQTWGAIEIEEEVDEIVITIYKIDDRWEL